MKTNQEKLKEAINIQRRMFARTYEQKVSCLIREKYTQDEEFAILARVVSCESNKSSRDDILAVMSVILNRADSGKYPNDPVSVVAAPYQFSCYTGDGITPNETVASVMRDALNGIRNNNYYGLY